jgi:hypothetical protein
MKKSTALKPSFGWLPFLVVLVPCLWGLSCWLWDWPLAVIAALMSVYLFVDAWNLVKTKRVAPKEPKFPEKNMPGM